MLMFCLDAAILIGLLKVMSEEEISFLGALGLSIATTIVAFILVLLCAIGFLLIIPDPQIAVILGAIIGAALTAVGLGAVLSAMFGESFNRACVIAGIFVVIHVALSLLI